MATAAVSSARSPGTDSHAGARLAFGIGGTGLALDIHDDASLRVVQDAYALLARETAPPRFHAAIRRLSDGRLHVRYGRQALHAAGAADPIPLRAAYHAAREVFGRFACEPANTVAVYGALCAVNGAAVLLLGPTAVGKTLLALHLARAGATFLGDDTALISLAAPEVYAMPRRPSLRESALPLLPDADMAQAIAQTASYFENERGKFWYALDSQALCGIEPSTRVYPIRAVCVLSARGDAAIREINHADAVKLVAQRAYARPTSLAQLGALRRALRHAACFDLTLGTPQASCELLLRTVNACA